MKNLILRTEDEKCDKCPLLNSLCTTVDNINFIINDKIGEITCLKIDLIQGIIKLKIKSYKEFRSVLENPYSDDINFIVRINNVEYLITPTLFENKIYKLWNGTELEIEFQSIKKI